MGVKGVLAWRIKAEKLNAIITTSLINSVVTNFLNRYGDPAVVNRELKNIGKDMGEFMFTRYVQASQKTVKGINDLADPKAAYNLAWKFFCGKTFDKTEFKKEGNDVYVTYSIKDCPICKDLISPSPQLFMCNENAGIMEWVGEQRLEDFQADSVTCDEVLCRARGDPVCQFVIHFHLKEPEFF
nr:hypothetical protein [Candidatus Freyarchaeota archaeon]